MPVTTFRALLDQRRSLLERIAVCEWVVSTLREFQSADADKTIDMEGTAVGVGSICEVMADVELMREMCRAQLKALEEKNWEPAKVSSKSKPVPSKKK